jgi:hypothetical protein
MPALLHVSVATDGIYYPLLPLLRLLPLVETVHSDSTLCTMCARILSDTAAQGAMRHLKSASPRIFILKIISFQGEMTVAYERKHLKLFIWIVLDSYARHIETSSFCAVS